MPEMGQDFVFEVEDPGAPGSWVPVHDMNSYSKSSSRTRSTFAVFMRPIPHTIVGAREVTWTFSGFLNMVDPGQEILRDAEEADDVVNIRVLPDGVNGFTQPVRVGSRTHDAEPENFQDYSFEFSAEDVATPVGAGPVV